MTVGQLIQKLKRLDPDMPVVIKPAGTRNFRDDFTELKPSDIIELKAKELYKMPYWGDQVYDASETCYEKTVQVLSLSGGTFFQRGSNEAKEK